MVAWDIANIFKTLGGVKGVAEACATYSPDAVQPQQNTIDVWKCRNRIAAEWLPAVAKAMIDAVGPAGLFTSVPPRVPADPKMRPATLESLGL